MLPLLSSLISHELEIPPPARPLSQAPSEVPMACREPRYLRRCRSQQARAQPPPLPTLLHLWVELTIRLLGWKLQLQTPSYSRQQIPYLNRLQHQPVNTTGILSLVLGFSVPFDISWAGLTRPTDTCPATQGHRWRAAQHRKKKFRYFVLPARLYFRGHFLTPLSSIILQHIVFSVAGWPRSVIRVSCATKQPPLRLTYSLHLRVSPVYSSRRWGAEGGRGDRQNLTRQAKPSPFSHPLAQLHTTGCKERALFWKRRVRRTPKQR